MFSGVTTVAGGHRTQNIGTLGRNNWFAGWHTISEVTETASVPYGVRPPYCWHMARKGGAIKSYRRGAIQLDATTVGEMGLPRTATGAMSLDATAVGGLVAGFSATAAMAFDATAAIDGLLSGTATFTATFDGLSTIEGDGFPTAAGLMTLDGSVDIYGVGFFTADTANDEVGLTPSNVGAAVWGALASANNAAGTMGEKLNDAGSASNPWTEVIESGLTAAEVLRLIAAALAGDAEGLENGSPVFKSLDGTKDRITGTYSGGVRTVTALDGT
jgi:hypothetical protein